MDKIALWFWEDGEPDAVIYHFEVYNETWHGEEMIQKMFGGWGDNGQWLREALKS